MILIYILAFLAGACLSAPHHETTYPLAVPHHHHAPIRKPSVVCKTEYATVWDTEYKETETQVCTTEYDKQCKTEYHALCLDTVRTECKTVYERKCETVYSTVCLEQFKTEYEPFIESECTTQYKTDCEYRWEGEGNSKVWAPIPGTCKENPYDECKDVPKTKERQVAYPVCNQVPQEKCMDVPSQACRDIPEQKCVDQPHETCQDIPRENCHNEHKKVPVRVSRKIPKQVCIHTDGHHTHEATPAVPPHHAPGPIVTPGVIVPAPVLPNINHRTAKAAKDIEEISKNNKEKDNESDPSDKQVQEESGKKKPNNAVIFRD